MKKMKDKDMLTDALATQKFIAGNYNQYAGECSTKRAKDKLMDILKEEHEIQFEIFEAMQKNGWYETTPAPQEKIKLAAQKFENAKPRN